MDALITGGAGFIGSNLAAELVGRGHHLRVIDNLATGSLENLDGVSLEFVEADIRELDAIHPLFEGAEVVFHQAAVPSVPRSVRDPVTSHAANATGTLNVLLAARDAGVRRVVAASSSSVYGNTPTLPKHEGMPTDPRSPYAVSKLAGEHYCRAFTQVYGLETVSLRYFNVFGPRQDPASPYAAVIPRFLTALMKGVSPLINGDGHQTRDFTYIHNVVDANIAAALADSRSAGTWLNIACGERTSLLDLFSMAQEITGRSDIPAEHGPPRPGDVRDSLADIELARDLIGYRPSVSLREGLARTAAWLAGRTASAS
jgi:nucleoside-diphosphate-sugar epimerase